MKQFIDKIDFKSLRKQKTTLINVIAKSTTTKTQKDNLTGILLLIDLIQDTAVDKYGFTEDEVFNQIQS